MTSSHCDRRWALIADKNRGTFTSVKDLITAIENFIDGWNERCHPFTWTKNADQLLDHCRPSKRTSFTQH
jgi:hypothetical protein